MNSPICPGCFKHIPATVPAGSCPKCGIYLMDDIAKVATPKPNESAQDVLEYITVYKNTRDWPEWETETCQELIGGVAFIYLQPLEILSVFWKAFKHKYNPFR